MSSLLDAFGDLDHETIAFLLDALENNSHQGQEVWEPLLDPFVDDPKAALTVLACDPLAVQKAKRAVQEKRLQEVPVELQAPPTAFPPIDKDNNPAILQDPSDILFDKTTPFTPIQGAENRAISLRQLRRVLLYIESHALDDAGNLPWIDRLEHSPTCGMQLTVHNINLHHVVDWIVKPLTEAHQCSFVELLATTAEQKPCWFVSHAWSEPVQDFVASVAKHAEIRGLSEDDFWWTCGYANNQHKIELEINSSDPKQTSFYRAMQQSEGVLLCLDDVATPLRRIWCCFEEAQIVQGRGKKLLLDIATVIDGEPHLLTDGFVQSDFREGEQFALEFKRDREGGFPLDLLELGYDIDICKANATCSEDKPRILNTIMGSVPVEELGSHEPDLEHPTFQRVNNSLRGIFAEMAVSKAADANRLEMPMEVLRSDGERTCLTLSLGGCSKSNIPELRHLAGHPALQTLSIDFNNSSIEDVSTVGKVVAQLPSLFVLRMSFAWCSRLTSAAWLASGFESLTMLTDLWLDFTSCNLSVLLPGIEDLKLLEKLYVNFSYTAIPVGKTSHNLQGIFRLKFLRHLTLLFRGCAQLQEECQFEGLEDLAPSLTNLRMDFSHSAITSFCPNINYLKSLECLSLDYSDTKANLQDKRLPVNVSGLPELKELELRLQGCQQVFKVYGQLFRNAWLRALKLDFSYSSIRDGKLLYQLAELPHLTECSLNFLKCTELVDVETWLPQAVAGIPKLDVNLSGCKRVASRLQAHFEDWESMAKAGGWEALSNTSKRNMPLQTSGLAQGSSSSFQLGSRVLYYSRYNQAWIPGVITVLQGTGIEAAKVQVEYYKDGNVFKSPVIRATNRERLRPLKT